MIIADNVFENARWGIHYNNPDSSANTITITGNHIRPGLDGEGIHYYTSVPWWPVSATAYLVIKGNVITPYQNLRSKALTLNALVRPVIVDNIFDGGYHYTHNNDPNVDISIMAHTRELIKVFERNHNREGTALRTESSFEWRPGSIDVIRFTPTVAGWYRIISGVGHIAGTVGAFVPTQDLPTNGSVKTDIEFNYRIRAYTTNTDPFGDINLTRQGSYLKWADSHGGAITKARIVRDAALNRLNLDILVTEVHDPQPVTLKIRGTDRGEVIRYPQLVNTTDPMEDPIPSAHVQVVEDFEDRTSP